LKCLYPILTFGQSGDLGIEWARELAGMALLTVMEMRLMAYDACPAKSKRRVTNWAPSRAIFRQKTWVHAKETPF
jgi:hypothetical protein